MSEEMICKNCKYHYIEEISFDYPQSCCAKRKAVIEEWFNCNDFEYSDRYIKQLQQKNKKLNGAIQTYDILLKANAEENKQLKIQISAREEVCNRLESNWNKLKEDLINDINYWQEQEKEWIKLGFIKFGGEANNKIIFKKVLDKMQELEQGSDDNNGTN